ncbi:MAG: hypothetical protein M1818_005254 [Claussenomyces sp. TS43310]|nr:MAG: hypothetical protein M1818_005254 [Claussenomyces sp. TS43310]
MATSGGVWAPIAMKMLKHAFNKTQNVIKARLAKTSLFYGKLEPVLVRVTPRQPISRAAAIRQSKGRWYTTHSTVNAAVRRFISTSPRTPAKYDRAAFPKSSVGTAVSRLTTRAPFTSTLRPNLTGGALPRTAGGYSLGGGRSGGIRHFSHTPAAPAQVVNNVSAAVRAFWLSGHKAHFDGLTIGGEKRYRAISNLQEETSRKLTSASNFSPGSYIDFHVTPTITALSPLGAAFPYAPAKAEAPTLNTDGFLDILSVDFSRTLKDLAAVMNDLKKLSSLGDLSITLEGKSTLRVSFPGCDAETVERLCEEVCVQRGVIHQDPDFDSSCGGHTALMFPFAPTSEHTLSSPGGSLRSQTGHDFDELDEFEDVSFLSSPEGYESMRDPSETESMYFGKQSEAYRSSSEYEGLEGIYRFLEECDNARRT